MPASRKKSRVTVPTLVPKAVLAKEIARILKDRELTQTEAASMAGEAPSQVSLIVNGRLAGVSPERLFRLLTALGRDVEIRLSASKSKAGKVRVTVK
jgi:transcriptional regulator with XRE-family HTH domain